MWVMEGESRQRRDRFRSFTGLMLGKPLAESMGVCGGSGVSGATSVFCAASALLLLNHSQAAAQWRTADMNRAYCIVTL